MKRLWSGTTKEDRLLEIEIQAHVEEIMDNIDCNYAEFSVGPMGCKFMRVFIYPIGEDDFKRAQIVMLTRAIQQAFRFVTTRTPKDCSEYKKQKYQWTREFRDSEGKFMVNREISWKYNDTEYRMLFLIENAPKLNCRIESKVVEQTVFEAICE